uniref:Reverse transcriptase zinc-binding domain-containing protein n=1 Tax=Brassica oleracea var. oleracea TaxID=109376 RepID=A0A0D3B681_BRAOL
MVFTWIRMKVGNGRLCRFWTDNWSPFGSLEGYILRGTTSRSGISRTATLSELCVEGQWALCSIPVPLKLSKLMGLVIWRLPGAVTEQLLERWPRERNCRGQLQAGLGAERLGWWRNRPSVSLKWDFADQREGHGFLDRKTEGKELRERKTDPNRDIRPDGRFKPPLLDASPSCSDATGTGSRALSMASVLSVPDGWLETKSSLFVYLGHVGMRLTRLGWQATIYWIWNERNNRLHRQHFRSTDALFRLIDRQIKDKLLSLRPSSPIISSTLMQLWL